MKKKILLSSVLTIAICLCLIAGSTFALFTSQAKIGIAVNAAKVEMTANISNLELYSVEATENGTIKDEFGGSYEYVGPLANFINGGTATFENGVLKLDRITPGDKVSFNVEGSNNSDVTVQYRYVVKCEGGEKLMSGLLVNVRGTTYPVLDSYTSPWATLNPGTDLTPETIVVEFPVSAGNEYQEETCEINVYVEAVQGNADVKDDGHPIVIFLDGYNGDLAGDTIEAVVNNSGTVELSNGTIDVDFAGFQNWGEATLNNMTINAGTKNDYAAISRDGATTVLNNVTVNSAGGAIGAIDGAQVTVNGGKYHVDSTSTSGRYNIYAVGEGTVVTVNGGDFSFNAKTQTKRAYAYVGAGATLYINGGNFGAASTRSGYTAGILTENSTATVVITGGTFGFDPTEWVADGYQAMKNGKTWYVVPENVDAIVSTVDQLQAALNAAEGEYVINVVANINGDVVAAQKADTKITINGNGNTFAGVLTVDGKSATILSAGLTVKNLVFKADAISADACVRLGDGTNATRYTCNVALIGCTFDVPGVVGVKSYTGGDKNVSIISCTATANAHSLAQLKGVDGVLVEECTVNAVRGVNLNNSDNVVIKDSTFDVEKYAVRFGESANTTVENYAVTNCTLTSDCAEGDAVIVLRSGATNANLDLSGTVINGTIEMTGYENANIVR